MDQVWHNLQCDASADLAELHHYTSLSMKYWTQICVVARYDDSAQSQVKGILSALSVASKLIIYDHI